MHKSGKPIGLRTTCLAIQYHSAVPSLRTRPRLRPGAFPRGGMFVPFEILRSVFGIHGETNAEPLMLIQPCFHGWPISSAPQLVNLGEAQNLGMAHSRPDPVPAESRANAPMQLAILHK